MTVCDSIMSKANPLIKGPWSEVSLFSDFREFTAYDIECRVTAGGNLFYGTCPRIPNLMIIEDSFEVCAEHLKEAIRVLKEEGEVLLSSLDAIQDLEE